MKAHLCTQWIKAVGYHYSFEILNNHKDMQRLRRALSEESRALRHISQNDRRLLRAAQRGAVSEVEEYLKDKSVNIVIFGPTGTPLHEASRLGHVKVATLLLEKGAPPNLMGDTNYAPLHLAAINGYRAITELLVKHGAKLNMESKSECRTALHLATARSHMSILNFLINEGADLDCRDIYGNTPLHVASRVGDIEIVELLVASKANVNLPDKDGWTALHHAAKSGNDEALHFLLDNKAFVDAQNRFGRTALHWACDCDQTSAVEILLNRNANPNIRDLNHRTAIQYARHPMILHMLRMHGAQDSRHSDALPNFMKKESIGTFLSLTPTSYSHIDSIRSSRTSGSMRSKSGSTQAIKLDYLKPLIEDTEIFHDSGIDDGSQDEVSMVNSKYRSLMRTVGGLVIVMGSKTATLSDLISRALDGNEKKTYVDSLRDVYAFVQDIDNSLVDFKQELVCEASELTHSLSDFIKSKVDSCCGDIILTESHRESNKLIAFLARVLASHQGSWRRLYKRLPMASSGEAHDFLNAVEAAFDNDHDRAIYVLFSWKGENPASTGDLGEIILEAAKRCDFEDETVLDDIAYVINNRAKFKVESSRRRNSVITDAELSLNQRRPLIKRTSLKKPIYILNLETDETIEEEDEDGAASSVI